MSKNINNLVETNPYTIIKQELQTLLNDENNFITILANTSALIYHELENINWVGFYLLYNTELKLGPFQGKVACQSIPINKGVCGTAATTKKVQLVNNVHNFDGHIACDSNTNSEIVLPLIIEKRLIGVLDVDSPVLNRFNISDQQELEKITAILCEKLYHTNIISFLQET